MSSEAFKKLEVAMLGKVPAEIKVITKKQAEDIVGSEITDTFLSNMKAFVLDAIQDKEDNEILLSVKNKLVDIFPDAVYKIERHGDKLMATIWLEGKIDYNG